MQDLTKQINELSTLAASSEDISALKSALMGTLELIEEMASELKKLRQDHDELDGYVCDIEEELDDIEDELDELEGWDEDDEEWDDDPEGEDPDDDGPPVNITPIDRWNRDKE